LLPVGYTIDRNTPSNTMAR